MLFRPLVTNLTSKLFHSYYRLFVTKVRKEDLLNEVKANSGIITLSSPKDEIFKLVKECRSFQGRRSHRQFLIEDFELIKNALHFGYPITRLLVNKRIFDDEKFADVRDQCVNKNVPMFVVPEELVKKVLHDSAETFDALAVAPTFDTQWRDLDQFNSFERLLLLESVGNTETLGEMIGVAGTFNVQGIVLVSSSSTQTDPIANEHDEKTTNYFDLLHHKVALRASGGAILRMPLIQIDSDTFFTWMRRNGFELTCVAPIPTKTVRQMRKESEKVQSERTNVPSDLKKVNKTKLRKLLSKVSFLPSKTALVMWTDNTESPLRNTFLKKADFFFEIYPSLAPLPAPTKLAILLHNMWGIPFRLSILTRKTIILPSKKKSPK